MKSFLCVVLCLCAAAVQAQEQVRYVSYFDQQGVSIAPIKYEVNVQRPLIRTAEYQAAVELLPPAVNQYQQGSTYGHGGHGGHRCDHRCKDRCQYRDPCECRALFLQCSRGTFTLDCNGGGVAAYCAPDCRYGESDARGAALRKSDESSYFVYYDEVGDGCTGKWAFSKTCAHDGHAIFKYNDRKVSPLDCDWTLFCRAYPNCGPRRCNEQRCSTFVPY
jgi:hypothetical protein